MIGWDLGRKLKTVKMGVFRGWQRLSLGYRGMVIGHLGFAVLLMGVTVVASSDQEHDVRLSIGDSVEVSGYQFRFSALHNVPGPNYEAVVGALEVSREGRFLFMMRPEKRRYPVQQQVMTEADIAPGLWRDLYVSLGESYEDGSWAIRIYYKPLMRWVWGGALLMALGGFIAIADRRYRVSVKAGQRVSAVNVEASQS
jgi:cytochrome c-type biogenesis protein CcmF